MKISAVSAAAALTGFAQLSLQAPTPTTTGAAAAATTTSAAHYYLQIRTSTNSTQTAWYGFVDPRSTPNNGVPFQFTPTKADATVFTLMDDKDEGVLLQGFKAGWVAGSTNAEGTATGGAVFQSPLDLFEQGGEPVVNAVVNPKNAGTLLTDRLGDGLVRNHSQTCYPSGVSTRNTTLPVLVVGEKAFTGCNNISLILTPAP